MLDTLPWLCVEVEEVAQDATVLIGKYGFQSYDAVHAATLFAAGLSDLVTRDNDFAALPQSVKLHTTSSRLAGTRRKRKR